MFWLIRKIFWMGVLVAVIYYGMNYQIDGKPVKQYVSEFFDSPLVQSVLKAGKEEVQELWDQQSGSPEPSTAKTSVKTTHSDADSHTGDQLTDEDRKALDQMMEKQAQ